jgi:hypothetical protein
MSKFRVIYQGCNHETIRTDQQLYQDIIEERLNPVTGVPEKIYVCEGCANGEAGFCHNSVLHAIEVVEPLSPLQEKRMTFR